MRRNLLAKVMIAIAVVVLPARVSFGWHATGHIIVALIAWEDLTPKTKAAITELLKQHPLYQRDLINDLPPGSTPEETDRFAFATAATWPDLVRAPDNPMHATYNHPNWHYIDIPYFHGVPATTKPESDQPGPHNVVEALQKCAADMKDPSVPAAERAVDICWVEHLVGDIHQPLHAIQLYSPAYPKGDRGGNDEMVLKDPPYPNTRDNLHSVWDGLPGEFHSQMIDRFEASGVRSAPKFSRDQLKSFLDVKDFMAWANESHQLAIEYAYLNGDLESAELHKGASGRSNGGADTIPGLPKGYLAKAESVAMQRVALAGYRLADVLNAAFDPKQ
jgi:hypothetical protein